MIKSTLQINEKGVFCNCKATDCIFCFKEKLMNEIHLTAPRGWINDPNGFIYYKGEYHLFYQHFPYAPKWGRMHWGHAVSRDLTDWEHKDIALFPTKTDDKDGCFSGSAVEADGKLHLFYTGVNYTVYDPENINCNLNDQFVSAQLHIASEDGYLFDNFGGKTTVLKPFENTGTGDITHTRDPKVWRGENGEWYMILGSTDGGKGKFLFFTSSDLLHWKYVNSFSRGGLGWMWECPDYFTVGGRGIVIFSPMGLPNGQQTLCGFSELDESTCEMKLSETVEYFDRGLDLYAPQSTVDKDGRRIVAAWLRMPAPMKNGAIGLFAIPRVCEVKNGHIFFMPHPNISGKFTQKTNSPEKVFMVRSTLEEGGILNVGGFVIRREKGKVITDRSAVTRANGGQFPNICETPEIIGTCSLEIYVDENIIEVFVNGGEYTVTNAVYDLTDRVFGGTNTEIYAMEE